MRKSKCLTDLPTGPLETIGGFLQGKTDVMNFTVCSKIVYHRIKGSPELWGDMENTAEHINTPEKLQKAESFLRWLIKYHPCKTMDFNARVVTYNLSTEGLVDNLGIALMAADKLEHLKLIAPFVTLIDLTGLLHDLKSLKTSSIHCDSFVACNDIVHHDHPCVELSLHMINTTTPSEATPWCSAWLPKGKLWFSCKPSPNITT